MILQIGQDLHQGKMKPEDLNRDLIKKTFNELNAGAKKGYGKDWVDLNSDKPDDTVLSLQKNLFQFSGVKTYATQLEIQSKMYDGDKLRSWEDFKKDVLAINAKYNKTYLQAEWQTARQAAHHTRNWKQYEENQDLFPNLKYKTAGDQRVRPDHAALANVVKPLNDPFWDKYYPPNGWRCRCYVVQTAEPITKQEVEDEDVKPEFRINVGKDNRAFNDKHPYFAIVTKNIIQFIQSINPFESLQIGEEIKTTVQLNKYFESISKNKTYFHHGFKEIKTERNKYNNGSTDLQGTIWLKNERIQLVKDAINSIQKGVKTTLEQEDALSTLWHEITHNKYKGTPKRLTKTQTQFMEVANEYVSRNTLEIFLRDLGGELNNKSLVTSRETTGYNQWVMNYQQLVEWSESGRIAVLNDVKNHLFNDDYSNQFEGLINAIQANSKYKFSKKDLQPIVANVLKMSQKEYRNYLENDKANLLIKK